MTQWELIGFAWLISGMLTLSVMDRQERAEGGSGRFRPINLANVMTIIAVLIFWPIAIVGGMIADRRRAQGKDDSGVLWKATLIIVAPFAVLLLPVLILAVFYGLAKRLLRRLRGIAPPEPRRLLQLPPWPAPEAHAAILSRLASDSGTTSDPAAGPPHARLIEIAWLYVGLRLAGISEEEAFRRLEASRGATHCAHPQELRAYLQWRLQQDDPGGPGIDPAAFPATAARAVNWVCDQYQASLERDFEPPENLVELRAPEDATTHPAEAALLRLIMDEGDALYRCVNDEGDPGDILLVRDGYALAHLSVAAASGPAAA